MTQVPPAGWRRARPPSVRSPTQEDQVQQAAVDTSPIPPGLTDADVAERVESGRVNRAPAGTSRSLWAIVRANVFTRFNAILGALLVVILTIGPLQDALFGIVLVTNTAIGIVQERWAPRPTPTPWPPRPGASRWCAPSCGRAPTASCAGSPGSCCPPPGSWWPA